MEKETTEIRISVCIATYNGAFFLKEQLDSILLQLGTSDEIIISDDASTDNTCNIINSYNDKRILLLHNNAHNFKWNFANALKHARGRYIFYADQDDVWLPDKIAHCMQLLENGYDLVVTDCILTDSNLKPEIQSFFQFNHSRKGLLRNIIKTNYIGANMAFQRWIYDEALPFPESNELAHDNWIGYVAEMIGKVYFLPEPLLLYRRHKHTYTNQLSPFWKRSKRSLFTKLKARLTMLIAVTRFYFTHLQLCRNVSHS